MLWGGAHVPRRRLPKDSRTLRGGVRVPAERSGANALGVHPALRNHMKPPDIRKKERHSKE